MDKYKRKVDWTPAVMVLVFFVAALIYGGTPAAAQVEVPPPPPTHFELPQGGRVFVACEDSPGGVPGELSFHPVNGQAAMIYCGQYPPPFPTVTPVPTPAGADFSYNK